ncbi:hypothetical protein BX661DRAFT_179509 [Kickxella alabastrina]|uniref:uncharacterized protein n=1 Tax=Kickxella alabastrina TaxID=61397 RepID=UPI0022202E8E|nr:uncharacterized protein BX661DRAFT_179509 [Kickxella alabastrina]KAI7831919.1 hypothetical protein BX661DRAFT_179509 [Kickxella alabastrina]
MSRYPKVVTPHNLLLFAAGMLLTSSATYAVLAPRMQRTAELQRQLNKIHCNMYWSMSLVQRKSPLLLHSPAVAKPTRPPWPQCWWNARVFDFTHWAAQPGFLVHHSGQARQLAADGLAAAWCQTKHAAAIAARDLALHTRHAVHWDAAVSLTQQLWADEKSKWQLAHASAIEAVHPHYSQPRDSFNPR